jgi:hypothetical protein
MLLLSGCIDDKNISGTYRLNNSKDNESFVLENDMTFYVSSENGRTLSGRYTFSDDGELRLIIQPLGSFSSFQKTETGFRHIKTGEMYVKENN